MRRGSRDQRQYVLDAPSIMRAHYSNLRPPDYKYHYHAPSLLHPPQFSFHLGFSTSTRSPRLLPSTSLRFYRKKKKSDVSTIKRSSYRVIPPTFPLSFWYLYLSFLNPIVSRNKSCEQRTFLLVRPVGRCKLVTFDPRLRSFEKICQAYRHVPPPLADRQM